MKSTSKQSPAKTQKQPVKTVKTCGEPIELSKSYTAHQLMQALDVSRITMYRWMKNLGLSNFATKLGGSWQITGEQYHAWLNWRRQQADK